MSMFITLEGPDGSGKTTQIRLLKTYLERKGYEVVQTREPGGTPISEKIRNIILDVNHTEMDPITEALLYAAARAQHVSEVIIPNLKAGRIVICDRFIDSSIVYQGYGRKLGDCVRVINEVAVKGYMPNVTFLLKLDPSIGKSRIREHDRLEMEKIEYHNIVYDAYLKLEKEYPERIIGINANQSIEKIHQDIAVHMDRLLDDIINLGV